MDSGTDREDIPWSKVEYRSKTGHLVRLVPSGAPRLIGFQEIGGGEDLLTIKLMARRATGGPIRRFSCAAGGIDGPKRPGHRTEASMRCGRRSN